MPRPSVSAKPSIKAKVRVQRSHISEGALPSPRDQMKTHTNQISLPACSEANINMRSSTVTWGTWKLSKALEQTGLVMTGVRKHSLQFFLRDLTYKLKPGSIPKSVKIWTWLMENGNLVTLNRVDVEGYLIYVAVFAWFLFFFFLWCRCFLNLL